MLKKRIDERAQLSAAVRLRLLGEPVVDPAQVPPRFNDSCTTQDP